MTATPPPVLRVLGPLVWEVGGRPAPLGGDKQRTVLALLAAAEGRAVAVTSLVDALWEDDAGDSAVATLQVHVSNLRRSLGAAGDGAPRVERLRDAYVLELGDAELDVALFRARCAEAASAREAGDAARAATRYRDALGLWRGPAYADLTGVRAVREIAVALDEDRLVAHERLVDAELAAGRHVEVVGELSVLVHQHPLVERFWEQYVLALYRSGRQADALAAYSTVRRLLSDELGVDPGEPLRRLEAAVLDHDPALDWVPAGGPGAEVTERAGSRTLPPARLVLPDATDLLLTPGRLVIGRDPTCGLVLDDPQVSRQHAEVVGTPDGYLLRDLGSTNGSYVGGHLTATRVLVRDDEITLGSTRLRFVLDDAG